MLLAQKEVRNFATADFDIRMDIAAQVASRREKLGYTTQRFAEALNGTEGISVTEEALLDVEQGIAFEGSHDVACAALIALERLETIRAGKAHLSLI